MEKIYFSYSRKKQKNSLLVRNFARQDAERDADEKRKKDIENELEWTDSSQ